MEKGGIKGLWRIWDSDIDIEDVYMLRKAVKWF